MKWKRLTRGTNDSVYETLDGQFQAQNIGGTEWRLLQRDPGSYGGWQWLQTFRHLRDAKAAVEAITRTDNPDAHRMHKSARDFALKYKFRLGRYGEGHGAKTGLYYLADADGNHDMISNGPRAIDAIRMMRKQRVMKSDKYRAGPGSVKSNPVEGGAEWLAVACKGGEVWYLHTSEAFDYWVTDESNATRFARQDHATHAARNEHRFRHGVGRGWMVGGVPAAWTRERILQECSGQAAPKSNPCGCKGNPKRSKARAAKVKKRAKKKTAKRNPVRRWIAYKTNGRSVKYAGSGKLMPLAWVTRRRDAKVWSAERTANTALKTLRDIERPSKGWVYGVIASSSSANDIKRVKGGGKRSSNPGSAAGLWVIFRCLGESVRFMTIRRGRVAWTEIAQDAVRFNYKSQAASEAHNAGKGAGNQGWQFGAAPEGMAARDIRAQCRQRAPGPGKP